jgi:hypothetical protein
MIVEMVKLGIGPVRITIVILIIYILIFHMSRNLSGFLESKKSILSLRQINKAEMKRRRPRGI